MSYDRSMSRHPLRCCDEIYIETPGLVALSQPNRSPLTFRFRLANLSRVESCATLWVHFTLTFYSACIIRLKEFVRRIRLQ